MKKGKKILLTALSATLTASLTSGLAISAFADTATKDHEFDGKNDVVYEDFDRADIADTVKAEGSGVNTGEKPYMHVKYTAGTSDTPGDAIYKHGSGSLAEVRNGGTIKFKMRAPENDVDLSEIAFGVRGVDDDKKVFSKTLDELTDADGNPLPDITTEWRDYEISFATSYEDTDIYPSTDTPVVGPDSAPLLAIHLYAATETDEGTLEIASVQYSTTGSAYLNDFRGGITPADTASVADSGCWWAGSSEGYIVKRTVNMTGGSFTVSKETAVGNYKYAIVEADGDVANLKIATSTDGIAYGTAEAFDGYSVTLNGNEKGFKFIYDGSAEGGVTVRRIYLTNLEVKVPAFAMPVIDASTAEMLESFSVAQSGINGNYDEMHAAPEAIAAGLEYRMSYSNGDKVEVKDGSLVFDATSLGESDYINFKFYSKTLASGKYAVLKVKTEGEATLDGLRISLMGSVDGLLTKAPVYASSWKAGVEYPTALIGDSNPYKTEDGWHYIVIDTEESGMGLDEAGYGGMDMYFSGTGKLLVDSIFFCNGIEVTLPDVEKKTELPDSKLDFAGNEGEYAYAGYLYIPNDGFGKTVEMDITPAVDNFDISNLRIQFEGVGTFWGSANDEGTLVTVDGKKLNELTYTKDAATHVVIDLEQSGIVGAFMHTHVHVGAIGGFKIGNVAVNTSTPVNAIKELDTENKTVVKDDNGTDNKVVEISSVEGYGYAGYIGSLTGKDGELSMDITVGENTDLSNLRFEFVSGGTLWAGANDSGSLYTNDGKLLTEVEFVAGESKTVVFDLAKSGVTVSDFHIHMGDFDGFVKLENITLTPYVDYLGMAIEEHLVPKYEEQLGLLPSYLDTVDPTVSITTATTAKAGDEITVVYTASDDLTAADDLSVTVSVTKDGNAVTLTGNKFTAEAGVYTVTVTVRDLAGNEASDTIQITVSGDDAPVVPPVVDSGCAGGCGAMTLEGGIMAGGMTLMGLGVLFVVNKAVRKRKSR